ncbi:MAG: hypothetical protein HYZ75_17300 [Elusimicrobia bacterium]|nr:hypothetical protein [Elusimicrobiota bacterium]
MAVIAGIPLVAGVLGGWKGGLRAGLIMGALFVVFGLIPTLTVTPGAVTPLSASNWVGLVLFLAAVLAGSAVLGAMLGGVGSLLRRLPLFDSRPKG